MLHKYYSIERYQR